MSTYDLIVIGSGPGGYVAAVRGAQNGLKTALIEKDSKLGGTCLLRGCIPTKSLLHSADVVDEIQHAKKDGLISGELELNFDAVQKARRKVITKSAAGVEYLMKKNKIDVHQGFGTVKDATTVEVDGDDGKTSLKTRHIILATGSVPRHLPFIKIDGKHFLSSDEILELKKPPKSLIVLGAGAVGMEFASIYARFGAECTVVEMLDRVLPIEDEEVSAEMAKCYKKRSINVHTSTRCEGATTKGGMVVATLNDGKRSFELKAEMMLVAIGRGPVTSKLGLEKLGIEVDKGGYIGVDSLMRTAV
ncbi:uncharacterized protein METZ01_LOCUS302456, partial [marine metagenome]